MSGSNCPRLAALLAAATAMLAPARAASEAQASFTYDQDIVWSTVVRLLRVDLGYEITEKDRENGYLLFVIHENGRQYHGAVEFVRGTGEGGVAVVELTVRVNGQPSCVEESILRKLRTKLREDYGLAPRPPVQQPPAPVPEEAVEGEQEDPEESGSD